MKNVDRIAGAPEPVGYASSGKVAIQRLPGRVLIADDEPLLLKGLARVLASAGFEVVTASDGREAADLLATQEFNAIVSDISMPGLNGIQLLRIVRERDLDVPVLLVTGAPAVETAVEALQYGAFQYLTKPVDTRLVQQVVERAVQLHRLALMKRQALALLGGPSAMAIDRAGLEASFARALDTLWMAYQPIVSAGDRTLFGHEALLRSTEPNLPHPGAIIDAAEQLDCLQDLGQRIRGRIAQSIEPRAEAGMVFVNLHPRDLLDPTLIAIDGPLSKIAKRVILEITERASLDEIKDVPARVAQLREIGFQIAIDDLGAGYAGLTSFALLEPEFVKLDMSLVRDVHRLPMKQKLIRSMAVLCKDMGMMVVAEGVETVEERDVLVGLGCDLLQGYLFAKPDEPFPSFTWGSP